MLATVDGISFRRFYVCEKCIPGLRSDASKYGVSLEITALPKRNAEKKHNE